MMLPTQGKILVCILSVVSSLGPSIAAPMSSSDVEMPTEFLNVSRNSTLIRRVPAKIRVDNSYLVHVTPGTSRDKIEELVQELRTWDGDPYLPYFTAKVHGILTKAAFGFTAEFSEQALQKVLMYKIVEFVQEDHYIKVGSVTEPRDVQYNWGLDRIDQVSHPLDWTFDPPCGLTGQGVDVYVIDSGIRYSHQEFENRAQFPGCDEIDIINNTSRKGRDCFGHGTHTASIIGGRELGVAPGVTLFSIRILNCDGQGTVNSVIQGIECVMNHSQSRNRSSVVNMSIFSLRNRAMKRATERMIRQGITVVTIAGNTNVSSRPKDSCKFTPASVHGVITAASSTETDEAYELSNAGGCVDIYAPGSNIPGASHRCWYCRKQVSGSSVSAPHITGAVALLLEKCPNLPPWKVKHYLLSHLSTKDRLDMRAIPKRLRSSTPNLLLYLNPLMCSLPC